MAHVAHELLFVSNLALKNIALTQHVCTSQVKGQSHTVHWETM